MKSTILDLSYYPMALRHGSKWIPGLVLFALVLSLTALILDEEVLAFMMSVLPRDADKSEAFYSDLLFLWISEVWWLGGFVLLAWMFATAMDSPRVLQWPWVAGRTRVLIVTIQVISLAFVLSVIVSSQTLDRFPNSADEYVYLFQAETLSEGKLWETPHPRADFFTFNHIAQKDGIRAGRFPPGWPLILSAAFYLNIPPFLINPFLGLIAMIVFFNFAKWFYDEKVALWATLSLGLSSYFIFNAASFFSHMSCLLVTVCFVYFIYLHFETKSIFYALLAGLFLGIIIIIRYYTAVIIFLPFFAWIVYQYRLKVIAPLFWIGVGSLPPLAYLLWYNYSITGNAFVPVTVWAYQNESLGFVRGHTLLKGVEHLIRWTFMFLYWCSPALLILYVVFLWKKIRSLSERIRRPQDYLFILLVIGYFFYYEIGGNQYGPRFFFEALPFLILFVVDRVFEYRRPWMVALFLAGLAVAVIKIPFIAHREHRIIEERQDIFTLSKRAGLKNAVVLVASHASVTRPMPIGDLLRNDVGYSNSVLYARDLPGRNEELFSFYPDREFYRYERDPGSVEGILVKIK